ncbi:hypothetical protein Ddc_13542 [Ditylenchus destructor]|nr:hypothetical protein Ddc_13542 [Ditylenchus destructor]
MVECLAEYEPLDNDTETVTCSKKQRGLENCVHFLITKNCNIHAAHEFINHLSIGQSEYSRECRALRFYIEHGEASKIISLPFMACFCAAIAVFFVGDRQRSVWTRCDVRMRCTLSSGFNRLPQKEKYSIAKLHI